IRKPHHGGISLNLQHPLRLDRHRFAKKLHQAYATRELRAVEDGDVGHNYESWFVASVIEFAAGLLRVRDARRTVRVSVVNGHELSVGPTRIASASCRRPRR